MSNERVVGVPQLIWGAIKLALSLAILATPIVGAWVSSSLAAYYNGSPRACVVAALLLFPILPLVWEGAASARRKTPSKARLFDRIVARTLLLNIVFLGVLLWRFPTPSYVALSTRGDWFLDGRSGVDHLREVVLSAARAFKFLDAKPNVYEKKTDKPVENKPVTSQATQQAKQPTPVTPTALWPQPMELHHAVREIPASEETSIESVGKYLAAHSSGDADRIKALHDWVADRIAYDTEALKSFPNVPAEALSAEPVFRRRMGVCGGYADLMRALGEVTHDQIVYVSGLAHIDFDLDPARNRHAWNAAMVDGHWQLVDATWDAGSGGDKFEKHYGNDYLFTPPEVFGVTHLPKDDAWQIRPTPIDEGAFLRQPILDPAFFRDGFRLLAPDRAQVTVTGTFTAQLEHRDGMSLLVQARPLKGGESHDCAVDDKFTVRCALPPGEYSVVLFDSKKTLGDYASIGQLGVNVTAP